jgi:hypothetical protein
MIRKHYIFILWFVFTIICIPFALNITQCLRYLRLKDSGIPVSATVEKLDQKNHQSIYYRYKFGDAEFSGIGQASRGNPDFRTIQIGQELYAVADPENPSVSCLGNPESHFDSSIGGFLFIVVAVPAVFAFGLYKNQNRIEKNDSN